MQNGMIRAEVAPALVVLGASGTIGRAVVAAAVDAGRPVIAVARHRTGLDALRAAHPQADLTLLRASVADERKARALATRLRAIGRPLAGVVAAVCGATARGRVLDAPSDFLRRKLDEDLLPHLFAARRLLPLLAADPHAGGYVLVGGPGGEQPWAGYGHRSVAAAALRMLARVLHDEARALNVRVQLLSVDAPARTEANAAQACPQWPSAQSIGRRALALVERDAPARVPAVVRHVEARATPSALWSDDLDTAPPTPRRALQEADGAAAALPARCLQDARRLLRSVLDASAAASTPNHRTPLSARTHANGLPPASRLPALPPPLPGSKP